VTNFLLINVKFYFSKEQQQPDDKMWDKEIKEEKSVAENKKSGNYLLINIEIMRIVTNVDFSFSLDVFLFVVL